ncbi:MAG TPA: Tox-REase-5 domain-containing protein [Myxococcaceae bacterium]
MPSYKLGESDGGPGQWEKAPVRPKGVGYQKDVTGAPEGVEYAVPARTSSGKVLFDGYKDGKLLDAKDWEQWPPVNAEFWQQGVLADVERQLSAARGTPIEWHLPNEDKAKAVRQFLENEGIKGIDVKVTRKK